MAAFTTKALSLPITAYGFHVTGLTTTGAKQSLTLTGFPEGFVPHGAVIQVVTTTASAATPDVAYCSYDESTLLAGAVGTGTVAIDLYIKTLAGNTVAVNLLVY